MANLNNDIEKYLRGELSPAERHALEQKALQDPFLAEALEGAEHAAPEEFSIDLELIKQSLTEKTKSKRRFIDIHGWQLYTGIAAGLLMLVLCTYTVIMMINQQKQNREIAMAEQDITTTDSAASTQPENTTETKNNEADAETTDDAEPVVKPQAEKPVAKAEEKKDPRERNDLALNERAKSRNAGSDNLARAGEVAVEKPESTIDTAQVSTYSYAEIAEAPVVASRDEIAKEEAEDVLAKGEVKEATADKDDQVLSRALQGKVAGVQVDEARKKKAAEGYVDIRGTGEMLIRGSVTDGNDPLPGVNVIVKGTTTGTVTDVKGEYLITVPAGSQTLVFNFIGLVAQEVALAQASNGRMDVVMQQDVTQLSEVVVTGMGSVNSSRAYPTFEMAEPEGGRRSFNKYLEDNVKYPQQARDNKVEGRVTIEFTVGTNGSLSNFKVIRGIGSGCDEELIRAIQHGPKWSSSKNDGAAFADQVRVRYRFELP
jgi:TonB family protein